MKLSLYKVLFESFDPNDLSEVDTTEDEPELEEMSGVSSIAGFTLPMGMTNKKKCKKCKEK